MPLDLTASFFIISTSQYKSMNIDIFANFPVLSRNGWSTRKLTTHCETNGNISKNITSAIMDDVFNIDIHEWFGQSQRSREGQVWEERTIAESERGGQGVTEAAFIIFPKLETRFNTPIKTCMQTPSVTSFSSCVYHRTLSWVRVERKALSLRSCIAQFYPWSRGHVGRSPLRRSVRDIKAFQNDFAFIISTETCFWLKRIPDCTFFGVSERRF